MKKKKKNIERWLRKMQPKKVLYEDIGYDPNCGVNVYACICPSCGLDIITFTDDDVKINSDDPEEMFHDSFTHHAYMGLNNFCNRCGQALLWGDEKKLKRRTMCE